MSRKKYGQSSTKQADKRTITSASNGEANLVSGAFALENEKGAWFARRRLSEKPGMSYKIFDK
ncbi:hypothetical protein AGMMS49579_02830 [Spirochaetia bacterium]|nr:hypothetical protein AGMMS49579_02830 [Spirochaetia bacterium]